MITGSVRFISSLMLVASLSACVFYPVSSGEQDYYLRCDMGTKRLSLDIADLSFNCDDDETFKDLRDCLVVGGIVSSASAIVSGSIVIAGNVIHWMEYKAVC